MKEEGFMQPDFHMAFYTHTSRPGESEECSACGHRFGFVYLVMTVDEVHSTLCSRCMKDFVTILIKEDEKSHDSRPV